MGILVLKSKAARMDISDEGVYFDNELIFNFPRPIDQRIPGYINGYVRRFWQVCAHYVLALSIEASLWHLKEWRLNFVT
jgi:hypothetical protein